MYWFIVDIVMVAAIIIVMIVSAHRGFLSSLIRCLSVAIAIIAAVVACRLLAEPIFKAWFRNGLIDSVSEKIVGAVDSADLVSSIDDGLLGVLIGIFGDKAMLGEFLSRLGSESTLSVATAIVDSVIKEPVLSLISLVIFILVFTLISFVISIVVKITGVLRVVPIIGGVNRLFGGVFGFFYGFGICYVAVAIFAFFFQITGNGQEYFRIVDDNTIFFAWLLRYNPIIKF